MKKPMLVIVSMITTVLGLNNALACDKDDAKKAEAIKIEGNVLDLIKRRIVVIDEKTGTLKIDEKAADELLKALDKNGKLEEALASDGSVCPG